MSLADMKPNDWAAIIFGLVGMVFALLAHRRAIAADERSARAESNSKLNEKRALELEYAQEKQEAVVMLYEEQLATDRGCRQLDAIKERAAAIHEVKLVESLTDSLKRRATYSQEVGEIKRAIEQMPSRSASHDDLLTLREAITKIKQRKTSRLEGEADDNRTVIAVNGVIELRHKAIEAFNSTRQRILDTPIPSPIPELLHQLRQFLIDSGWSTRPGVQPFFEKWLTRTAIINGNEAVNVFTPEEMTTLALELRELELR